MDFLPADRFVALDVEIASKAPLAVCAIGAVRIETGREVAAYSSLVQYRGRVKFTRIHGLTRSDLFNAPEWPAVWAALSHLADGVTEVVAYRAEFDRAAVLVMCARYGIRPPQWHFSCAAQLIEARFRRRFALSDALEALGQPFPGRPHDALADARAAAAVVRACSSRTPDGSGPIQFS